MNMHQSERASSVLRFGLYCWKASFRHGKEGENGENCNRNGPAGKGRSGEHGDCAAARKHGGMEVF